ncbi:hypothetical protein M0R45_020599 [Rubus argutus]|uniref:Protein kinase domain-containing protein n=1 Tax=Rubus argutus TaxID=59490 RepID=A0AAW1XB54_RUBAR
MHRDIKGANILVDNKGCIKLADFGASKKVVELATINGAKSMKGTPYWMAPEVILQTGHSFSADIWSVGCTVIEMATGKPPWSQTVSGEFFFKFRVVSLQRLWSKIRVFLFRLLLSSILGQQNLIHPFPDHLSAEAKDFLLKCLEKEPDFRSAASELLQHPFVAGDYQEPRSVIRTSVMEAGNQMATPGTNPKSFMNPSIRRSTCAGLKDICDMGTVRCSTICDGFWRINKFQSHV